MSSKILAFIAAVTLMFVTVPPLKVKAQGLVEYALILVVVYLGPGETGEVYLVQKSRPTQAQDSIKVAFIYQVQRVSPPDPSGNGICQETVQVPLEVSPGLEVLQIQLGEGKDILLVNGEEVQLTEACLKDAEGVAVTMGRKIPPEMAERIAADPTAANGLGLQEVWGYTTVSADGSTAATSSRVLRGKPLFFPLIN